MLTFTQHLVHDQYKNRVGDRTGATVKNEAVCPITPTMHVEVGASIMQCMLSHMPIQFGFHASLPRVKY